jgi:hypothetical protein
MSKKEIKRVVGVDPETKRLIVETKGGELVEQRVEKLKKTSQRKLSEKARKAINVFKPIAKEVVMDRSAYLEDDDAYFAEMEAQTSSSDFPTDDYRKKRGKAAAILMGEGLSSYDVAEVILRENPEVVTSRALGTITDEVFEKAVGDLAEKIVSYYPRNFTGRDVYPRK